MTGRPLGRASLPGRGEARLAGTLWTLCGWHAARPCGGGPGACLRGDPRGRRVRCPWGPRARGRTSVRPDPDPGTPRRVTCSRLGPGHTRPVARTMEEGEEGRRPPPPPRPRSPGRAPPGRSRAPVAGPRAARQSPAGASGSEAQSPGRRAPPAALRPPSPRSVPAGPGSLREAGPRQRRPCRASPPPSFPRASARGEQMWAPAVTGCICSVPFTGIQTRPQWAAFVRGH